MLLKWRNGLAASVILEATCWAGWEDTWPSMWGGVGGGGVRQFTYTIAVHADRENNKNQLAKQT